MVDTTRQFCSNDMVNGDDVNESKRLSNAELRFKIEPSHKTNRRFESKKSNTEAKRNPINIAFAVDT